VYTAAFAVRGLAARPSAQALAQRFAIDDAADPRLRVTAIRALGRPGEPQAAEILLEVLKVRDLSTVLTLEVMSALAATRDPRAFDVMVDRFTDRRPQIRVRGPRACRWHRTGPGRIGAGPGAQRGY